MNELSLLHELHRHLTDEAQALRRYEEALTIRLDYPSDWNRNSIGHARNGAQSRLSDIELFAVHCARDIKRGSMSPGCSYVATGRTLAEEVNTAAQRVVWWQGKADQETQSTHAARHRAAAHFSLDSVPRRSARGGRFQRCYVCGGDCEGGVYRREVYTGSDNRVYWGRNLGFSHGHRSGIRSVCHDCAMRIDTANAPNTQHWAYRLDTQVARANGLVRERVRVMPRRTKIAVFSILVVVVICLEWIS